MARNTATSKNPPTAVKKTAVKTSAKEAGMASPRAPALKRVAAKAAKAAKAGKFTEPVIKVADALSADVRSRTTEDRIKAALSPITMTGYSVNTWIIREELMRGDAMYALGFSSYAQLEQHQEELRESPLDKPRELLIRLYYLEPRLPYLFVPPDFEEVLDYLFNLHPSRYLEKERSRCATLFARLLDKDRGAAYRWLRPGHGKGRSMTLPVQRLFSKLFSMDRETARSIFWKVAMIVLEARGDDFLREQLQKQLEKRRGSDD
jgi:hypothetical protein